MSNYWLDQCLEMWSNGTDYVIAYDQNDAMKICEAIMSYDWDEMEEWEWVTMDGDFPFTYEDPNGVQCTHPVSYFIAAYGHSYFCCGEF